MQPSSSHVASITGLRAIAVLAVILYHVDATWMPGGFVGVDIFFVISGFVVAHSVMGRPYPTWRAFLADFYTRRFLRLYPALLAFVAVATAASLLFIPLVEPTRDFERFGAAAALGISNFMLKDAATGYFSVASEFNPFTHTWSLAVEEQYYLLFTLFAFPLLARREGRARPWLVALVAAAALGSLAWCAAATATAPSFAFYMLPMRFWELALGLLLRIAVDAPVLTGLAARRAWLGEGVSWPALAALLWACGITPEQGFPWPGALLPCLATAALIGALWLWRDCRVARLLASPVPLWIGLASYSLYLWHWGVVVFMRWTVGVDSLELQLLALAATFALGGASHRWIEGAFHHSRRRAAWQPSQVLLRFAGASALVVSLSLLAMGVKPQVSLAAASRLDVWNPYSGPAEERPCKARFVSRAEGNARIAHFAAPCLRPDARRLFVLGDSHAAAYRRMLWRVAETGAWDVRLYALDGCGFVNFRMREREAPCEAFTAAVIADIGRQAQEGDVIFLPSLQTARLLNTWGRPEPPAYGTAIAPAIMRANRERLAKLAGLGLPIVVEGAKPLMPIALFRCADWFNRAQRYCRDGASVSRAAMAERMRLPETALHRIAEGLPRVTIWDPAPLLCPGARCDGYDGTLPLFFDVDHLSAHANDLLLRPFLGTIDAAAPRGPEVLARSGA